MHVKWWKGLYGSGWLDAVLCTLLCECACALSVLRVCVSRKPLRYQEGASLWLWDQEAAEKHMRTRFDWAGRMDHS